MSTSGALGIAITDVSTTAQAPLGSLAYEPATSVGTKGDMGEQVWIYVFNDSAANLVAGSVCSRKAATSTYNVQKVPVNTNAWTICGVAQHAILIGSYGYILRKGLGEVLADGGGVTANEGLIAGDVIGTADVAAAATSAVFGWSTETIASALATCYVNCQG